MELYKKYRPKSIKTIIGNTSVLKAIKGFKEFPHAILLTGPSGCGKTSLGRIIAKMIGSKGMDYVELDTAVFRGIDTVRDIRQKMTYKPIESKARVWLIDECFIAGTKVNIKGGYKEIQEFVPMDKILSLNGQDTILGVMKKQIPLDRLICLTFNGNKVFTTKDHLFLTDTGFVPAITLTKNNLIYTANSYNMLDVNWDNTFIGGKNGKRMLLQVMRKGYRQIISTLAKKTENVLREILPTQSSKYTNEEQSRRMEKEYAFKGIKKKSTEEHKNSIIKNETGIKTKTRFSFFKKNEIKQSDGQPKECNKSQGNKKNKWDLTYLAWRTWWERSFNRTAENTCLCFGLGNGTCYKFGSMEKGISNKLQSRYRKQGINVGNRSGRTESQIEKEYIIRSKENKKIKPIRVEGVAVYESTNPNRCFQGIIGDKERNSGTITMYDLQVKDHPSYFVNDLPVHNCHQLGVGGSSEKNIAQNALLKMLEDPPEHVYFILCTTNPEMLIPTVKGRCTSFEMKTLMNDEMETLLTRICKKEKKGIPDPVKDQIIQDAEGHPRNALNILDKVLVLDDEDEMLEMAKQEGLKTNAIKDLCYALLDGKEWKNIQSILKGIRTEQPETIRRAILGMMGSAILDGWGDHKKVDAWGIMSWFYEKPTYDCGFAGITFCCKAITDGQACPYGG